MKSPHPVLPALLAVLLAATGCTVGSSRSNRLLPVRTSEPPAPKFAPWTNASSHRWRVLPPDLLPLHDPACARRPLAKSWLAAENDRRGTTGWSELPAVGRLGLYVDTPSVTCGTALVLHLGGQGARGVRVVVLRIGWYHGTGARQVWESRPGDVPPRAEPVASNHAVPDAGWTTAVRVPVPDTWAPGLYLAEADLAGHPVSAAAFVVQRRLTAARLVVVHSNLTWAAYSTAGGANLYRGLTRREQGHQVDLATRGRRTSVAARAYTVTLARPTTGPGLAGLFTYDVPLAELCDRLGLPVDHVMDTDVEVHPSLLAGHVGVVLPGHSEYWTTRMYDALTVERNRGVNLADFGANTVYWHTRVTVTHAGSPINETVYRYYDLDAAGQQLPTGATVRWSDPSLARPASAVLGQTYVAALAHGGLAMHHPPRWLIAGTQVHDGTALPSAVLNEANGAVSTDTAMPTDLQVVAEGVLRGAKGQEKVVSSSYYADVSGAGVFSAGTTTWLCGALGRCFNGAIRELVPAVTTRALFGILGNVLRAFAQPRWGATHPSRRDVPVSAAALLDNLPAGAVGSYGPEPQAEARPDAARRATAQRHRAAVHVLK